ncbi:helix-turn-helix domain-containing protein [Salimicrobium salexigens]|uniref:DNA-binding transcriptional regulator, XRE-family HTH domain n=1 Tax=Salimicrobium salexigens TaxID=908941 RepID=A0ABY1KXW3_9BACI|nr:helix-turn-helix transcriptional regulator [Salimicrobium salexigens]SIS90624.1 DNA-binding transcriptional regulator, XRE-family HTH domain [Salimicrobium salexigens]
MENSLGARLKSLRKRSGKSQAELAKHLGISTAYIGFLEKGTRKGSDDMLGKMADYFNISFDELLQLRDEDFYYNPDKDTRSYSSEESSAALTPLEELNKELSSLDPSIQEQMVIELKEALQKKLDGLITAYALDQVEQLIDKVKNYWLSFAKEKPHDKPSLKKINFS